MVHIVSELVESEKTPHEINWKFIKNEYVKILFQQVYV